MQPVRGAQDLECAQSKLHSLETKLSAIASVGGGGGGPADPAASEVVQAELASQQDEVEALKATLAAAAESGDDAAAAAAQVSLDEATTKLAAVEAEASQGGSEDGLQGILAKIDAVRAAQGCLSALSVLL
jgi:hypothetical protein